jgi:hypothetical protein
MVKEQVDVKGLPSTSSCTWLPTKAKPRSQGKFAASCKNLGVGPGLGEGTHM